MSSSSTDTSSLVPPGQNPPFAVVSDTDHSAWVIIATALGFSYTLLFGAIRIFVREGGRRNFAYDDYIIAASTVVTAIQSALILAACSYGFGKSIELVPVDNLLGIQKLLYGGSLLYIIALGLSKISVVFFLFRLTPDRNQKRIFIIGAIVMAVWMVGSFLAFAFQCNLAHPWIILEEKCTAELRRVQVVAALDIATELGIVGLALYLVWSLNTSKSTKASVVGVFCFRLLGLVAIAYRIKTFDEVGNTTNPTLLNSLFVVWTETELNYSLISATVLILRPFANNLNTRFGGIDQSTSDPYYYGNATASRPRFTSSFQMTSLKSFGRSRVKEENSIIEAPTHLPPHIHAPITTITAGDVNNMHKPRDGIKKDNSISGDSYDSQQMIIRKDMTWEVEHETVR